MTATSNVNLLIVEKVLATTKERNLLGKEEKRPGKQYLLEGKKKQKQSKKHRTLGMEKRKGEKGGSNSSICRRSTRFGWTNTRELESIFFFGDFEGGQVITITRTTDRCRLLMVSRWQLWTRNGTSTLHGDNMGQNTEKKFIVVQYYMQYSTYFGKIPTCILFLDNLPR